MQQNRITLVAGTDTRDPALVAAQAAARDAAIARALAAAHKGDAQALFDLGMVFAIGDAVVEIDLIEAHKWFNLAAVSGVCGAAQCRADVADDMTAREIAEAQRRARAWLRTRPTSQVA